MRLMPISADISYNTLAERSEGYTGADIAAVCQQAALIALEEDMAAEQVCMRHFTAAFESVHASAALDGSILRMYETISRQVP